MLNQVPSFSFRLYLIFLLFFFLLFIKLLATLGDDGVIHGRREKEII